MRLVHAALVSVSLTTVTAPSALAAAPTLAVWPAEAAGPHRRVYALVVAAAGARAEWVMPAAENRHRAAADRVKAGCRRRPAERCAVDLANAVGAQVALLIDAGPRQTGLVLLDPASGRELGRKVVSSRAKPAAIAAAVAALAAASRTAPAAPVAVARGAPEPPASVSGDPPRVATAPPASVSGDAPQVAPTPPALVSRDAPQAAVAPEPVATIAVAPASAVPPSTPPARGTTPPDAGVEAPLAASAVSPAPWPSTSTGGPAHAVHAPADATPRFGVGLHLDLLFPAARTGDVTFNGQMEPAAGRTITVAVLAEGRYYLPPLSDVAVSLEVGWYRLSSAGSRVNDADPDFPSFSYSSSVHAFPALLGAWYRLSRLLPVLPLQLHAGAGFSAEYVRATTTYTAAGTATQNAAQTDFGWGYWIAGEVGLELGPGLVTGTVRYVSARTDLRFSQIYDGAYNEQPGETGGTSVLLGYRLPL